MKGKGRSVLALSAVLVAGVAHESGVSSQAPTAQAMSSRAAANAGVSPEGFYTVEQAARGRRLFNQWCASCHTLTGTTQLATGRGIWLGSKRLLLNLGDPAVRNYVSVYHLFRRVRDSMPAFDVDALSATAKVEIVAYLLQQNRFPAGPVELPLDVPLMKTMRLATLAREDGFKHLFNGRDFTGIKFLLGPNCRPSPEGCGRTSPGNVFWVAHGEFITSGKIQGYWYTDDMYLNFTLRFDYRQVPPPDWEHVDDDEYDGNTGYLLFIRDHRVWPKGIEIQGRHMDLLSAFGIDSVIKSTTDAAARTRARKPVGEWQGVEIVSRNGQVKCYLNETLISTVTEHEFTAPGHIGFQSEGSEVHWRDIRIKTE